jgi:hypothetical protein
LRPHRTPSRLSPSEAETKAQAHCGIALCVHPYLLERGVEQALEIYPLNAYACHAVKIIQPRLRHFPRHEPDENSTQLVNASDGRCGIVDGW